MTDPTWTDLGATAGTSHTDWEWRGDDGVIRGRAWQVRDDQPGWIVATNVKLSDDWLNETVADEAAALELVAGVQAWAALNVPPPWHELGGLGYGSGYIWRDPGGTDQQVAWAMPRDDGWEVVIRADNGSAFKPHGAIVEKRLTEVEARRLVHGLRQWNRY
jgi:hypothetical protein